MAPTRRSFTAEEWSIVRRLTNPTKVQRFLNALTYNDEQQKPTLYTFRNVMRHMSAHCLEAALAAAVILEQHGYPTLVLDLASQDHLDHVVFLYKEAGRWGTVGRSRDPGLHGRKPVFRSLKQLVDSYADPFVDFSGRLVAYGSYDLANLGNYDWRFSERNAWRVERVLIEMPHRPYRMPGARYRFWYQRYLAYKNRFPHRKPLYYSNRSDWKPGYPKNP